MKRLLFAVLLAFLASTAEAQAASSIVFNWTNTNSSVPACSSTVTSNCLVGQTLTDTTANSVISSSISPAATTYTYTPATFPAPGTRNYSLVVNYKDGSGTAQVTSAATASVTIPLVVNAPTGFSVTLK